MFNIFKTVSYSPLQEEDASSSSDYEPFHERGQRAKALIPALPWMVSTFVLGLCLLITLLLDSPFSERESFETGYATEMQAAVHTIELEEVRFWGGIKADENGTFYMHFNPKDEIRYVGKPSRELDDAWDRLTGKFIPLTKKESESVRGDISEHRGSYLAATTVQHSLHCLNYLRQALYDDNYPSIHLVRPHIPDYWLHVDHCIETLRQVLQCGGDLTPVPKVWNGAAGQLLADIELVHTCRKFDNIIEWTESR